MKLRNSSLTVPTATFLHSLAFANAYGDAIRAAFNRDFGHEFAARHSPPARIEVDALDAIDVGLRDKPVPGTRTVDPDSMRTHGTQTGQTFPGVYLDPFAQS